MNTTQTSLKKFGFQSIFKILKTVLLFGFLNLLLIVVAFVFLINSDLAFDQIIFFIVILVISVSCFLLGIYQTYKQVLVDVLSKVYQQAQPFVNSFSKEVLTTAKQMLQNNSAITNKELAKMVNYASIVNQKFSTSPKIVKWAVIQFLGKIPLAGFVLDHKDEIVNGSASNADLENKINQYANDYTNKSKSWNWWYVLLGFNVVALIGITLFKLS